MGNSRKLAVAALVGTIGASGVAAALVACGGDVGDGGTGDGGNDAAVTPDGYVPPTSDATVTNDAAPPDDAATGTDADASPIDDAGDAALIDVDAEPDAAVDSGPQVFGIADFTTFMKCNADGPQPYSDGVGFVEAIPAAGNGTCQVTQINASCTLNECTGVVASPTLKSVVANAGPISVFEYDPDGGLIGDAAAKVYTLNDAGFYQAPGDPFYGTPNGGHLTISAPGATGDGGVGAFSLDLPSPSILQVTLPSNTVTPPPVCGAPGKTTLSFDHDLGVAWTNGIAGASLVVNVTVDAADAGAGVDAGDHTAFVSCTFDQAVGAGVVPSAGGLAQLATGGGSSGSITFSNTATASTASSDGVPVRGSDTKLTSPYAIRFTTQ